MLAYIYERLSRCIYEGHWSGSSSLLVATQATSDTAEGATVSTITTRLCDGTNEKSAIQLILIQISNDTKLASVTLVGKPYQ